ncbi:MAG: hypothetical protein CMK09_15980 [Ponticaulis sp.]|nr:hypothetical protein [Ponticaulis sp.]
MPLNSGMSESESSMTAARSDGARRRNRKGLETRARILESAVACINRLGYAATTVDAIMQDTGLSRGSVLNQFPTRTEMMVEVADYAMHATIRHSNRLLAEFGTSREAVIGFFDVTWKGQQTPHGIAMTEILLAARWDAALAEGLKPIAEQVETEIDDQAGKTAESAGVEDLAAWLTHVRVLILSLRGIVIESTYDDDRPAIRQAVVRLRQMHERQCGRLLPGKP